MAATPSLRRLAEDPHQDTFLRRQTIERLTSADLGYLDSPLSDSYYPATENVIGTMHLPVGVAGPVPVFVNAVKSSSSPLTTYLPLATTEGALVASVNRGCKAIREAGSAQVTVVNHGITRAPVLKAATSDQAYQIATYCQNNIAKLNRLLTRSSQHTRLLKITTQVVDTHVYLRCHFDTDQAMGMNMATIAAQTIYVHLTEKFSARLIAISSNYCSDKKPNYLNMAAGRGREVTATATLNDELISRILKTTPEKLLAVYHAKIVLGSQLAGSLGRNAQMANVAAAIYLATGQDPGHVVEASHGMTIVENLPNKNLKIICWVPNILVGLIGGGTKYPTQQAGLAITNHQNSVDNLAAIIGTAILAGEISLLGSLAENTLACSHQKLGRKRSMKYEV